MRPATAAGASCGAHPGRAVQLVALYRIQYRHGGGQPGAQLERARSRPGRKEVAERPNPVGEEGEDIAY